MCPKQIIIQSLSNDFLNILNEELLHLPSIRYNYWKANGLYTISIKCANYYQHFNKSSSDSFYGSYIYLYTSISLLISSLVITFFEKTLIKRFLNLYYFYFSDDDQIQIKNIASSILDPNFPIEINQTLYLFRKEAILNSLLKNFRKRNYINIDSFVNFSLESYMSEIESAVDKAVELHLANISYVELIQLLLDNLLF